MGNKNVVLKFLNFAFWIVVLLIIFGKVYTILEPSIIKSMGDKNNITDENILNELAQCTNIYVDTIINKQYISANKLSDFFNQKSNKKYDIIYNKVVKTPNYRIIIKEIYKLNNETFRCYFLIKDNTDSSIDYLNKTDKSMMNVIILSLNEKKSTFKVLYDVFK